MVEELLAGELPPDLLEAAEDARVRLLPGYGDLEADCDCDAFDHPCKHAAALCYQASWLLDEDAMLLLLLRGRGAQEAQEELRSVLLMQAIIGGLGDEDEDDADDGAANDEAQQEETRAAAVQLPDGTSAEEVFGRAPAPLPELPPLPGPPPGRTPPPPGWEPTPWSSWSPPRPCAPVNCSPTPTVSPPSRPAPLDLWRDCVRIAATRPGAQVLARLREACGSPQQLDRAAEAWRLGGSAGLDVLEEAWTPPQADIARARTALTAGWEHSELPELEVRDNRWTLAGTGLQLRYGRDGRWYPYRQQDGRWWPAAAPHHDPAEVLAELLDG
ncbi:Putative NRPS cluster protein OS=Streptomyces glaucescens OX=1907 GN=SGLAU_04360 PE=4 SV=1 [Streptomyces glaucescens]